MKRGQKGSLPHLNPLREKARDGFFIFFGKEDEKGLTVVGAMW